MVNSRMQAIVGAIHESPVTKNASFANDETRIRRWW